MMKFREIAARITGFSVPVFGVQWSPPTLDIQVARKIIAFLEDRRVLYSPFFQEDPGQCFLSVIEIRAFLTELLGEGGIGLELTDAARAIRAACRRFLLEATQSSSPIGRPLVKLHIDSNTKKTTIVRDLRNDPPPLDAETFYRALGTFRAFVGSQVAQICVRYGVDLEPELASIIPPFDEDSTE